MSPVSLSLYDTVKHTHTHAHTLPNALSHTHTHTLTVANIALLQTSVNVDGRRKSTKLRDVDGNDGDDGDDGDDNDDQNSIFPISRKEQKKSPRCRYFHCSLFKPIFLLFTKSNEIVFFD